MRKQPPLLAPLFRSDSQARLLSELFLSGEDELTMAVLGERTATPYSTVHREIQRLLDTGLLEERRIGNMRMIRPSPGSPLTRPVRDLLLVSIGPVPLLTAALADVRGVEKSFLFGSFAARLAGEPGPATNDIDLMVVGDPDVMAVYELCREVGDQVGRPINPTMMSRDEFAADTGFLTHLRQNTTIPITRADD